MQHPFYYCFMTDERPGRLSLMSLFLYNDEVVDLLSCFFCADFRTIELQCVCKDNERARTQTHLGVETIRAVI